MKKFIWVVTFLGLCILACKKKDGETPTPEMKKYEYKRTPGEVTKIEGDIYVDTGGTVFTVKGKGFDPKKKKHYHLMLMKSRGDESNTTKFQEFLPKTAFYQDIKDTAHMVSINDSVMQFVVRTKNVYSSRNRKDGSFGQSIKDTVDLLLAVTSPDSTNLQNITSKFDSLKTQKVKNKLFFNILTDTLHWHRTTSSSDVVLTLDDIWGGGETDYVEVYFNDKKLNTAGVSPYHFISFSSNYAVIGDGYFLFAKDSYNANKGLGLTEGTYTISMKESKTGLPIESKNGKNKIYLKYVN